MAAMHEDQGAAGFFMVVRSDPSVVTNPFVYATDDRLFDYLGVICQRGFEPNRVVAKLEGFAIAEFDPSCAYAVAVRIKTTLTKEISDDHEQQ